MYEVKQFTIPKLKGISEKNIEEHLKLYEGYVTNCNSIIEAKQEKDTQLSPYALSEMQRRFSFEFDGMRNHEYFFASLEGGAHPLTEGPLYTAITSTWGSYETWLNEFKTLAKTRGIGWAVLYYDTHANKLINNWVDEQHLGHLTGCHPIIMLDMWEHSFVADYHPSGKATYIDDFFENINWSVIEKNFSTAQL